MTSSPERQKILVVDDNPEEIWPLVEYLEEEFDMLTATSGKKALQLVFSCNPPDLILLDIMLPDMDGYEIYSTLKSDDRSKDIPSIFLTSKADEQAETKGLEIGALDYITKPFSLTVARARIKRALSLKKAIINRRLPRKYPQPDRQETKLPPLSKRELEVLNLLASGLANKGIADQLFISLGTVKAHLASIFRKLEVNSRIQAVVEAKKHKLLSAKNKNE